MKRLEFILPRGADGIIKINDDTRLVILKINGDRVDIGIDAPRDTSIHREEVYMRIKNEQNGTTKKCK